MPKQQLNEEEPITLHCVVEIQRWAFENLSPAQFDQVIDAELNSTMRDMKEAFMGKYNELHGG